VFENAPLLELAIGRSTVRQSILALLIGAPQVRLHLREIQRRVGTSPGTASRELARLVGAGLVDREAEGVQVYFRASDSPVAAMMRQLLLVQNDRPSSRPTRIPRQRSKRLPEVATDSIADAPGTPPAENEKPEAAPAGKAPAAVEKPAVFGKPAAAAGADAIAEAEVASAPGRTTFAGAPATPPSPAPVLPDPLALVVAARFCAAVRPLYDERLKSVYLYGARASSPAPEEADIELLVVLDSVPSYGEELERTSGVCAGLSLELGLIVSRVFVAQEQWVSPGRGFVAVMPGEEAGR
jgi:DNA-binding transcriptional ArsR family regulator